MYCYQGAGLFMSTSTVCRKIPRRLDKEFSKFRQKSFYKWKHQLLVFFFFFFVLAWTQRQYSDSFMSATCLLTTPTPLKWHAKTTYTQWQCGTPGAVTIYTQSKWRPLVSTRGCGTVTIQLEGGISPLVHRSPVRLAWLQGARFAQPLSFHACIHLSNLL